MSETVQLEPEIIAPAFDLEKSSDMLDEGLLELAGFLPEVAERQAEISEAGKEIIEAFGVEAEFFDDKAKLLAFTAVASRLAISNNHESVGARGAGLDSVATVSVMLLRDYATKQRDLIDEVYQPSGEFIISEEAEHNVCEKFTNQSLSDQLRAEIDGDLLGGVKDKLGITPENEDVYKVRVLEIARDRHEAGLRTLPKEPEETGDAEKDAAANKRWKAEVQAARDRSEYLLEQTEQFKSELGLDALPAAWASHYQDGSAELNISMPYAESILHPEDFYLDELPAQSEWYRGLSLLAHEYVHTQGSLLLDNRVGLGIALEERRAEYFSGDLGSYGDVKHGFNAVLEMTGMSIKDVFDASESGGRNASEIYSVIAGQVGLESFLDILTIAPADYYNYDNMNVNWAALNHELGGFDGFLAGLEQRVVAAGGRQAINERIAKHSDKFYELFDLDSLTFLENHIGKSYQLGEIGTRAVRLAKERSEAVQVDEAGNRTEW